MLYTRAPFLLSTRLHTRYRGLSGVALSFAPPSGLPLLLGYTLRTAHHPWCSARAADYTDSGVDYGDARPYRRGSGGQGNAHVHGHPRCAAGQRRNSDLCHAWGIPS